MWKGREKLQKFKYMENEKSFLDGMKNQSGLVGEGVVVRMGRFPVQTPLGAQLGLGTQPCYEAPGDLEVENVNCSN